MPYKEKTLKTKNKHERSCPESKLFWVRLGSRSKAKQIWHTLAYTATLTRATDQHQIPASPWKCSPSRSGVWQASPASLKRGSLLPIPFSILCQQAACSLNGPLANLHPHWNSILSHNSIKKLNNNFASLELTPSPPPFSHPFTVFPRAGDFPFHLFLVLCPERNA